MPKGAEGEKRPRDLNVWAKRMVDIASGEAQDREPTPEERCHHKDGYFHIMGGKGDFFHKDTWLLLAPPRELSPALFLKCAQPVEQGECCLQLLLDLGVNRTGSRSTAISASAERQTRSPLA